MMRWYRTSEKCISLIAHSDEEYRQRVTTQNTKKDNKKEKREAKVGNVGVGTCKQKIQLTISISIRQWERSRKRGLPQRKEKKICTKRGWAFRLPRLRESGMWWSDLDETNINYKRKKETKLSQWREDSGNWERGF